MKKLTLLLSIISINASAQTMYKMESLPIYDEDGNVYQMRQVFDHLPTSEDSAIFKKDTKNYMVEIDRARKEKMGNKSYQAIVADVRSDKQGNIVIKPNSKFKSSWYRCWDKEVKIGDTIWISKDDAIVPKF
jgi:hypothetical protein